MTFIVVHILSYPSENPVGYNRIWTNTKEVDGTESDDTSEGLATRYQG